MQTKVCTKCKKRKNDSEYYRFKNRSLQPCKPCYAASRDKQKVRAYNFHYKYGLTMAAYNLLLDKYNHRCAICESSEKLVVDHNHTTQQIRGILCDACNRGIGFLQDSASLLIKAANYLS